MPQTRIADMGALEVPHYADVPMQGVANWVNPFNQVEVLALHYTAHSEHRTMAWKADAQREYTDQAWEQEFEINFKSYAGRPVYSSFRRSYHVYQPRTQAEMDLAGKKILLTHFPGREMICGWDVGTHAAVMAQLANRRLYIYAARQSAGAFNTKSLTRSQFEDQEYNVTGLGQFIQLVKEFRSQEWPGVTWRDVGDPSIANETVQKQGTTEMIFRQNGIKIQMAPTNKIINRLNVVNDWLDWGPGGIAGFVIDPSATLVIEGMAGGYKYAKDGAGDEPEKGAWSHTQDCIQYVCLSLEFQPYGKSRQAREVQPQNVDAELLRQQYKRLHRQREEDAGRETESWNDW